MQFTIQDEQDIRVVRMSGRFTFEDHSKFLPVLNEIKSKSSSTYVFDFSEVNFVDSAALGLMMIAKDSATNNNIKISIRGASGKVKTIFEVVRFDESFEMLS